MDSKTCGFCGLPFTKHKKGSWKNFALRKYCTQNCAQRASEGKKPCDPEKRCLGCGEWKPLDDFHRAESGLGGRQARCKVCLAETAQVRWTKISAYKRGIRYPVPPDLVSKVCCHCGAEKPTGQFARNAGQPDGLDPMCKQCGNEKRRRWREANPDKVAEQGQRSKHRERARSFGMTPQELDGWIAARLEEQGNRCAICGVSFEGEARPCIDHCHQTAAPRGLLCSNCNSGLGYFRDSATSLFAAAEYARTWERKRLALSG